MAILIDTSILGRLANRADGDHWVAAPDVSATASTREAALAALESAIAERLDQGGLVALEVGRAGLAGLFGKYRDDPTLREICETAYHERDADVRE